ncbi:MAG: PAS domain-containing protein [Myxococcaceae bacterium]|nr:PAS domain-containing protein [Myxococcaceae bacterium]
MVDTRFPGWRKVSGFRLGAWLTAGLDRLFLPRAPHELAPGDRSRSRVVAITASVLLCVAVLFLLALQEMLVRPGVRLSASLIAGGSAVGYAGTLLLLRLRRAPRLPSLALCLLIASSYISSNLVLANPGGATHLISPLLTLLAFFLLGARGGFSLAAVMSLYALVLQPLFLSESSRWVAHTGGNLLAVGDVFAAVCNMGVWGLSWLHSRAREQAVAALEQTLKSQHEGERKLSSLVESTDDIVCSLDTEGRLLTANAAMRRWCSRLLGQEPRLGEPLTLPSFMEHHPEFPESFARALQGERVRVELVYPAGDSQLALDFSLTPITGEDGRPEGVTIFGRDTTARRQAEARLSELHRTLVETSRKAGMAEIATGVLHNVGNTLNSVNVSASLVAERLHGSRVAGIVRATELMREHAADLGAFLTRDERGRLLPEYLLAVSKQLAEEQATMWVEVQTLTKNVEHIKSVVSMQQEYARFGGLEEQVSLPELLDDALRLHATSFERLGIQVRREYAPVPPTMVDRHKLLQILVNLLSNARHALLKGTRPDKQLTLRISVQPRGRLWIQVADNGVGITPEHLPRMFTQGFTTKKDGHGFGLHASALAASDMNGSLTCTSAGPQQGATFTIELPLTSEQASA